jgi:hypothetical protein
MMTTRLAAGRVGDGGQVAIAPGVDRSAPDALFAGCVTLEPQPIVNAPAVITRRESALADEARDASFMATTDTTFGWIGRIRRHDR